MDTHTIATQAKTWLDIYTYNATHRDYPFDETPNGPGSRTDTTVAVRTWLPKLIEHYDIHSILDAPCGDWNWMSYLHKYLILNNIKYIGADINPDVIDDNTKTWPQHQFRCANLLTDDTDYLPVVDLIICRDFMIHLTNDQITTLLNQICTSGCTYLLATHNPQATNNEDDSTDDRWIGYHNRRVNLETEPFNMPAHIDSIPENNTWNSDRTWDDKQLALYQLT